MLCAPRERRALERARKEARTRAAAYVKMKQGGGGGGGGGGGTQAATLGLLAESGEVLQTIDWM